ncbi:hypothetical protein NDA14_005947 [Ustilago hordei]|nr:hypothetical protein NDA14_005947 [Ustilago hordei]
MPSQPNNLHPTNDPSLKDSSDDQAETIPAPADHQRTAKHNTNSSDNSDSNDTKTSSYKLPSKHCGFLHEVTQLNDALKDTPKLTMKNWHTWNPCFQDILALWSPALKHLNSTTKLGDKKYCQKLGAKLHTIIQSNTKLISQDNINYLFM